MKDTLPPSQLALMKSSEAHNQITHINIIPRRGYQHVQYDEVHLKEHRARVN